MDGIIRSPSSMPTVCCKRIYLPASAADGQRVLIERLWPRGISRADAALDLWLKEIAPSTDLRRWYGHEARRWAGFQRRYRDELVANGVAVEQLLELTGDAPLTLVYAAREQPGNSAQVLRAYLLEQLR